MYVLFVILSMTSLVAGASLAKSLFDILGAETTSVLRLAVASIFMTLFWRPWRFKIKAHDIFNILPYGCCLGMMNFTFYLAIQRLPIGLAIAIEFLGPLSIAILHSKKWTDFLWVTMAVIGILLILPLSNTNSSLDPIGITFALIAAVFWASYIKLGKRTASKVVPSLAIPLGMLIGFLITLPFGIKNIPAAFSSMKIIFLVCSVGLLSSAIPYSLEFIALKKIPPKNFSLLLSLEPVIGSLGAFLFLKEQLSLLEFLAMACIITASVGSNINIQKEN